MSSKINKLLLKDKKTYTVCVLDDISLENAFLNETAQKLKNGTDILEFDGTKLCGKDYLSIAKKLRDLCGVFNSLLILKDRIDVAKLAGADGIILNDASILPAEAHKLTEDNLLLGYYAHGGILPAQNDLLVIDFIVSDIAVNTDIKSFRAK